MIDVRKVSLPIVAGSNGDAGNLLRITLCRTERSNAFSSELVETLIAALSDEMLADISLVVFRAEGRNFCTGFDLSNVDEQSDADLLLRFVRIETLLSRIADMPCLTMAFVHGKAFGAGADLVAACDLRIAAYDAVFRFPGWRFGIALGTRRLVDRIGSAHAQGVLTSSNVIDAVTAERIGLVTKLDDANMWDRIEQETAHSVSRLSRIWVSEIAGATRTQVNFADADLGRLVRSASLPGLGSRIQKYIEAESLLR